MHKRHLLFAIILIEGYVVLASELLAIRQLIPFVGSGVETVSIIISAVLLPLAVGYHAGGQSCIRHRKSTTHFSPRRLLLRNLLWALIILSLGLSHYIIDQLFSFFIHIGIRHHLLQTAIYSGIFLVYPVFLLGQTVPLVSHYFARHRLSEITGLMLFFSTTGSFLGSIFSTIVLMSFIGVSNTLIITMSLLALLCLLLVRRWYSITTLTCAVVIAGLFWANTSEETRKKNIVSDNAYSQIRILTDDDKKTFIVNRSKSSQLNEENEATFEYVSYIDEVFIHPLSKKHPARDILILGAGGFTIGLHDRMNRYTFVDIDPDIKRTAETHFLPNPLGENKHFVPISARAFLKGTNKRYDLIILDAYTNIASIPAEMISREFLLDVKARLKKRGTIIANAIVSPDFSDKFSARYHNTFTSVFPLSTRQVMQRFSWAQRRKHNANVLYIYHDSPFAGERGYYTDDLSSYSLDR